MNWFDFVVLTLAADAAVTAWFDGSIFEPIRKRSEKDVEDNKEKASLLSKLSTCPLCFSYHTPFWLIVLLLVPALLVSEPWNTLFKLPMYSLAATDLVHWLQGIRTLAGNEDDSDGSDGDDEENSEAVP